MTRRRLNRLLAIVIVIVVLYASVMTLAKLALGWGDLFDLMKELAPLAIGVAAALLANAFQKRSAFIEFLRDEWYNIVETKTALVSYCRKKDKTEADGLAAWADISTAIDRMRIVYRNVGETQSLIGFYPYEPLHDMRREIEVALGYRNEDRPAPATPPTDVDWVAVEGRIWGAFLSMREVFLEELDLTEPDYPILARGRGRRKTQGAADDGQRKKRADEELVKRA